MSVLAKMKLVSSKQTESASPIQIQRMKMTAKIDEQIALVTARINGQQYEAVTTRVKTDPESGQRIKVNVPKRIKEWFWETDSGKLNLSLRYGSKVIELAKGKNAIELSDSTELLESLKLIKSAVLAGELDSAIKAASEKLRAGFAK